MSIPMILRAIDADKYEWLLREPAEFEFFFYGPLEVRMRNGVPATSPRLYSILYSGKGPRVRGVPETLATDAWEDPLPEDLLDIDKSYEALSVLLQGCGFYDIPDDRVPLCPEGCMAREAGEEGSSAFLLDPSEVVLWRNAIAPIDEQELRRRYNDPELQAAMKKSGVGGERGERDFQYVLDHFEDLKVLVSRTADAGRALIIRFLV